MIKYEVPHSWVKFNLEAILPYLTEAKAAVMSLTTIPFQREWVESLQAVQLKREVAGTSRIEGADFTENELDAAMSEGAEELHTRSQRQARAALKTYKWIGGLPADLPIDAGLICQVHRYIVTDCDDDHCPPGEIRGRDQNVTFGAPRHRGVDGGSACEDAFRGLCEAINGEFRGHDDLIRALALHYHFAAMHPFLDGNGRTARALEALVLQRAGLRDSAFIAMSNYYYDEKIKYLDALSAVRANNHDLTPFLVFGLRGVALQCKRLFAEIRNNVSKALFRNVMYDLFQRLESPRKRVLVERQIETLKVLLRNDKMDFRELLPHLFRFYQKLKNPEKAILRDLDSLMDLGCITLRRESAEGPLVVRLNLDWPTQITETEFHRKTKTLPKARVHPFL